jgi:hypothetical protein
MTKPQHEVKEILWCGKCETFKHRDYFGSDAGAKSGKQSKCKRCTNRNNKKWYLANKERHAENQKRRNLADHDKYSAVNRSWYQRNKESVKERSKQWRRNNPIKRLLIHAKQRSREMGWEFTATAEELVVPEFCPALGLKLEWSAGYRADNSPSLDRIDSRFGYVKGNVHIISWRANNVKNNATADELLAIGTYMKRLENARA